MDFEFTDDQVSLRDAARGGVARMWKIYLIRVANHHLGSERVVALHALLDSCIELLGDNDALDDAPAA